MSFHRKQADAIAEQITALRAEAEQITSRSADEVTPEEIEAADAKIAEATELRAKYDEHTRLADELDALGDVVVRGEVVAEGEQAKVREAAFNVNVRTDPFDLSTAPERGTPERYSDLNARVVDVIENSRSFREHDHSESATIVMERTGGMAAEQTLLSMHPKYISGFAKHMAGAAAECDADERAIMAEVDGLIRGRGAESNFFANDASTRALNVTDNVTAKLVPAHLDPSIILTNAGAANPFRQLGRTIPITTNVWTGVSSAGVTIGWTGTDATEVDDDSPSFSNPTIQAAMWDAFIPMSIQAHQDWFSAESELAILVSDAYERLTAQSFATGSGSNQPFGLVTALSGTSSQVNMATNTSFTVTDLLSAKDALGRRYRTGSSWIANEVYGNYIRQFGTNDGSLYTVSLDAERPDRILGRPFYDSSGMTSALNSSATNNSMIYGKIDDCYYIVDRVGTTMEFVPHLFATNANRPSLSRGLLWYGRTGADSVNDNAAVLLVNPKTT